MDADTPVFALVAISIIGIGVLLVTPLIEALVGRKWRALDRLDAIRIPVPTKSWEVLYLGGVLAFALVLVALLQALMLLILVEPNHAPLTKVIAGLELALVIAWIVALVRFARRTDVGGERT